MYKSPFDKNMPQNQMHDETYESQWDFYLGWFFFIVAILIIVMAMFSS